MIVLPPLGSTLIVKYLMRCAPRLAMETSETIESIRRVVDELDAELHASDARRESRAFEGKVSQLIRLARQAVREVDTGARRDDERLLSLLESSIDAIYLRNLKTDRYDYMSPVIEQITGFPVDEMKAMSLAEVLERIHPDDLDSVKIEMERVRDGGKGIVEYRFRGRDGHYRTLSDSIHTHSDRHGVPLYRIGIVRDISERKQMEHSLRSSEDRYRSLVELSPDALFINLKNRIVFANPALVRLVGASSAGQIVGKTPFDIIHPRYHGVVRERIERQLSGETAPLIEEQIVRLDGAIVDVEVAASPFMTDEGMAIQVILRDITERKRAEEVLLERQRQLEELNRTLEIRVDEETRKNREKDFLLIHQSRQAEMGEMINIIAHQWRQPLNTIGLYAQLLTETYRHGELDVECLEDTVRNILKLLKHMSQTIEDFKNFLKPGRGRMQFNIKETIAGVYALIAESFKAHGIRVDIEGDGELVVTGYPNEYAQAVMNILNNAKDALVERMVREPRVGVRVARDGDRSVVTIADNAGGIAEKLLDRIFEPYFTTRECSRGTGIGLYMSQAIIVKNMHGRLSVRNTSEGAEFRIEV
jgi:PAS domain S-box-containing protein